MSAEHTFKVKGPTGILEVTTGNVVTIMVQLTVDDGEPIMLELSSFEVEGIFRHASADWVRIRFKEEK